MRSVQREERLTLQVKTLAPLKLKHEGGIMSEKPAGCTDEHLVYLDDLRDSGATNMFGARPYLVNEFGLDKNLAGEILSYWMGTLRRKNSHAND